MVDKLTTAEVDSLLDTLEERFSANMERHPEIKWENILEKIKKSPKHLEVLSEMEQTGGEPDIVGNKYIFMDCSTESPKGRRKLCYDRPALEARKKNKPESDVLTVAKEIGIELLTEEEYRYLQTYGQFDLKTSTWVATPENIRNLGGAIFCD